MEQSKTIKNKNKTIGDARKNQKNKEYCCIVRISMKKNNIFVNLTDLKGRTIIKFSSGLIQKNKSRKQLSSIMKFVIEKLSYFIKNNFHFTKLIIKGHRTKSFSYLREFKQKNIRIIFFQNQVPIVHNGCRPPKKRRI